MPLKPNHLQVPRCSINTSYKKTFKTTIFLHTMRLAIPIPWLVAINAIIATANAQTSLQEAILTDILEAYSTHEPSTCTSPESVSATSFSFDWPGANSNSGWYGPFQPFEEGMFNAIMSHTDVNDRSWSIRIGSSGNMYSHYTPDMWGETIPPQKHDEVNNNSLPKHI